MRHNDGDPKVAALRSLAAFRECSLAELRTFARSLDEFEVPKGTILSTENEAGKNVYVVVDGLAEARRVGVLLWHFRPGDLLGEFRLDVAAPALATITASSPMRLMALLPAAHAQVFQLPGVARWATTQVARRLRHVLGAPQAWPVAPHMPGIVPTSETLPV